MSFTAVVASHDNEPGLVHILGELRYQTRPPDETLVYASGKCDLMRVRELFPEAQCYEVPNMEDWGHEKRARGLDAATQEWIGFFNDDDSYHREYIEKMLTAANQGKADAAYCNWSGIPNPSFSMGSSTSGNFIVLTALGQHVGYPSRRYEADGDFINSIAGLTDRIVYVPEMLYFHNGGVR